MYETVKCHNNELIFHLNTLSLYEVLKSQMWYSNTLNTELNTFFKRLSIQILHNK